MNSDMFPYIQPILSLTMPGPSSPTIFPRVSPMTPPTPPIINKMFKKKPSTWTLEQDERPFSSFGWGTSNTVQFEPLLDSEEPISLYPIRHPDIWEFYKRHQSTFWTAEEVDLTSDKTQWNELTKEEKWFIKMVLAFFANSDFIVADNLSTDFIQRVKYKELQFYYQFQIMIENIHSQVYADLIETYIDDEKEKKTLNEAVFEIPIIKKKAEWAKKYVTMFSDNPSKNFVYRLLVFSMVEGIFFSSSFCAIFWLKKQNKLHGLTFSNELISRDEGLHRDLACHVYKNHIQHKLPVEEVIEILKDATALEQEFCKESIPVSLIGMKVDDMCQYVAYVADQLLFELVGKKIYHVQNPFPWMTMISMAKKTNFFERRVGEYSKQTNLNTVGSDRDLSFDGSF